MKRLLLCILGVAGMVMTAFAQQDFLVVWHKDGSKVLFKLSEKPKVIYGDSLVTIQSSTMVEYAFQAIQKMTFESEEVVGHVRTDLPLRLLPHQESRRGIRHGLRRLFLLRCALLHRVARANRESAA